MTNARHMALASAGSLGVMALAGCGGDAQAVGPEALDGVAAIGVGLFALGCWCVLWGIPAAIAIIGLVGVLKTLGSPAGSLGVAVVAAVAGWVGYRLILVVVLKVSQSLFAFFPSLVTKCIAWGVKEGITHQSVLKKVTQAGAENADAVMPAAMSAYTDLFLDPAGLVHSLELILDGFGF